MLAASCAVTKLSAYHSSSVSPPRPLPNARAHQTGFLQKLNGGGIYSQQRFICCLRDPIYQWVYVIWTILYRLIETSTRDIEVRQPACPALPSVDIHEYFCVSLCFDSQQASSSEEYLERPIPGYRYRMFVCFPIPPPDPLPSPRTGRPLCQATGFLLPPGSLSRCTASA